LQRFYNVRILLMKIRTLFIGTAQFAVPILEAIIQADSLDLVGIITQPDRPSGRKQELKPSPVKQNAPNDLKIFQPEKIKLEAQEILDKTKPELIVVAAYGQILPELMINYPKYKCLNLHGSLLPTYRGAVPIEKTLLNGDRFAGVSLLQMTPGLDDGPVLAEQEYEILPEDDAASLRFILAQLGAKMLINKLPDWFKGKLEPITQDELAEETGRELTFCSVKDMSRDNAKITAEDSQQQVWNKVRAFVQMGGAWFTTTINGKEVEIKIFAAVPINNQSAAKNTDLKFFNVDKKLVLAWENGELEILELQVAGKTRGMANDYLWLAN